MKLITYTDGASRGNPGPASLGVVVMDENGKVLREIGQILGTQTNNFAEYSAVVRALEECIELGAVEVEMRMDSQLVVRQMLGEYKIKNSNIIPLANKVKELLKQIKKAKFVHVPRAENAWPDKLANEALDA